MVTLNVLLATLGGLCPALVWLFFWIMEDSSDPEPRRYIFYSFVAGALAVFPTLLLQSIAQEYFPPMSLGLLGAWAVIEESMIFAAAYYSALRLWVYDEPIDAVMYMVTAALGFSALENAFFLWPQIVDGNILNSIALGESRFLGATLVHVLSSSTLGIALALSFRKPAQLRKMYALCGIILAAILHTTYNYFILTTMGTDAQKGLETFWIFVCVWFGIIATLLFIERLKIKKPIGN